MSAATHEEIGSGTPSIEWLCDGVERDRSHVLVLCVTPVASSANAPALLARRYAGSFEVVSASLATLEPDVALARILDDQEAMSSAGLEVRLQRRIEALSARGSAMLLALPDATSIPAATLRRLGDLASASKHGLRLALFADCEADSVDMLAANLVCNLGVGVEKVVVGLRPGQATGPSESVANGGAPEAHPAALRGPPRIEHEPLPWWARGRPIRVRSQVRHPHARSAHWLGVGFIAALLVVWWLSPDFEGLIVPVPEPVSDSLVAGLDTASLPPVDQPPPEPPDAASGEADSASILLPEPISLAEIDPIPDEPSASQVAATAPVGLAPPQPESHRVPIVPTRTISVNMNARPWAHVELDGRSIGTTPLADVPIEIGPHRVVLKFPDGAVLERTVEVDAFSRYLRFP